MSQTKLTGKQKRYLRGLAHSMKPLVQVGKLGVSEALCQQVDTSLTAHELIKVKLLESYPEDVRTCAEQISIQTQSQVVQTIGKTMILYRAHPEEPVIILPN